MMGVLDMRILRYLAFSALLTMSVSGAIAQNYDQGYAAWSNWDYRTALNELLPLAKQGNANAQYMVGFMYLGNRFASKNVVQDFAEALKWYDLAARQGIPAAQGGIGTMYEVGLGVVQSNVRAHMWFNIAAANGDLTARNRRDFLAAEMTKDDISKAQSLATECMKSNYQNCGD
jgi:TPR repeat protein